MTAEEVIRIKNLYVSLAGTPVLEDINLTVYQGDFLGIIGPNGGGKSTLLRSILGLVKPDKGEISIAGGSVEKNHTLIGYVPQYAVFDRSFPVKVRDVVLMGRLAKRRGRFYSRQDYEQMERCLELVEMQELRNRPIGDLSGGERQRVLVARALVADPIILLLDEPTASVDSHFQATFYELLERLSKTMTIILVSHDITAISTYVSTIACLNRTLHYQHNKELTTEMIEHGYNCPVELIAHGIPHRVLHAHDGVVG